MACSAARVTLLHGVEDGALPPKPSDHRAARKLVPRTRCKPALIDDRDYPLRHIAKTPARVGDDGCREPCSNHMVQRILGQFARCSRLARRSRRNENQVQALTDLEILQRKSAWP